MRAAVRQAVSELQSENIFPDYDLEIVYATLEANTYPATFKAARELIEMNVVAVVLPQRITALREYFVSVVWGLRIPVLALYCDLRTELDYPCFSILTSGISYYWAIDATVRLGFDRAVALYVPTVTSPTALEAFAQSAPNLDLRTIQIRSGITNTTITSALDGRETCFIFIGGNTLPLISLLRKAVGPDRAKSMAFVTTISQIQPPYAAWFPSDWSGEENGVFDVGQYPFSIAEALVGRMSAREGWDNTTAFNTARLKNFANTFGVMMYAPVKMWGYAFRSLIVNKSAEAIATSYDARPPIDRTLYLSAFNKTGIDGSIRSLGGIPFFAYDSLVKNFKLNENRTAATYTTLKLGTGSATAAGGGGGNPMFLNAVFGDGTGKRPPSVLPYETVHFEGTGTYYAGFVLGGVAGGLNVVLLGLLCALRNRASVKSASWVSDSLLFVF
ncbi:hypothetical protein HK102_008993 [Quaeritorhiza haematococci]|nr:hypothetical protein HK102_008993 [Quaeritorhiza haematococci]